MFCLCVFVLLCCICVCAGLTIATCAVEPAHLTLPVKLTALMQPSKRLHLHSTCDKRGRHFITDACSYYSRATKTAYSYIGQCIDLVYEKGLQLTFRSSWPMGSAPVDGICPQKPHVPSTLITISKPPIIALEHDTKHSHTVRLPPQNSRICDRVIAAVFFVSTL
jgi:hypothetical protein